MISSTVKLIIIFFDGLGKKTNLVWVILLMVIGESGFSNQLLGIILR